MKKLLFSFILFSQTLLSQQLNLDETLKYIEKIENKYRIEWSHSQIKYELNSEGFLIQKEYYLKDKNVLKEKISVHVDDIIKSVSIEDEDYIKLKCKNKNCFTVYKRLKFDEDKFETDYINHDEYLQRGIIFVVRQEYEAKKMINAINYLFSLMNNKTFLRDFNDPFAQPLIDTPISSNQKNGKIPLEEKNGTFRVKVQIKSLNIPFVLDSGAAEISISSKIEKQLLANGAITKNDYLPNGLYKVADGRVITQRRVLLRKIKIGQFTVRNVPASIGKEGVPLLLGKNFLDKFSNWSINNSNKTLELKI